MPDLINYELGSGEKVDRLLQAKLLRQEDLLGITAQQKYVLESCCVQSLLKAKKITVDRAKALTANEWFKLENEAVESLLLASRSSVEEVLGYSQTQLARLQTFHGFYLILHGLLTLEQVCSLEGESFDKFEIDPVRLDQVLIRYGFFTIDELSLIGDDMYVLASRLKQMNRTMNEIESLRILLWKSLVTQDHLTSEDLLSMSRSELTRTQALFSYELIRSGKMDVREALELYDDELDRLKPLYPLFKKGMLPISKVIDCHSFGMGALRYSSIIALLLKGELTLMQLEALPDREVRRLASPELVGLFNEKVITLAGVRQFPATYFDALQSPAGQSSAPVLLRALHAAANEEAEDFFLNFPLKKNKSVERFCSHVDVLLQHAEVNPKVFWPAIERRVLKSTCAKLGVNLSKANAGFYAFCRQVYGCLSINVSKEASQLSQVNAQRTQGYRRYCSFTMFPSASYFPGELKRHSGSVQWLLGEDSEARLLDERRDLVPK